MLKTKNKFKTPRVIFTSDIVSVSGVGDFIYEYSAFISAFGNNRNVGQKVRYIIREDDFEYEIGDGVLVNKNTIKRISVYESSINNELISFKNDRIYFLSCQIEVED